MFGQSGDASSRRAALDRKAAGQVLRENAVSRSRSTLNGGRPDHPDHRMAQLAERQIQSLGVFTYFDGTLATLRGFGGHFSGALHHFIGRRCRLGNAASDFRQVAAALLLHRRPQSIDVAMALISPIVFSIRATAATDGAGRAAHRADMLGDFLS